MGYSQARLHEFHGRGRPHSPYEPLDEPGEAGPVTLQRAHHDHDEIRVGVNFCGVADAVVHFFAAVDLLHRRARYLHGKELGYLVSQVDGRVEYDVPAMETCGNIDFSFLGISCSLFRLYFYNY